MKYFTANHTNPYSAFFFLLVFVRVCSLLIILMCSLVTGACTRSVNEESSAGIIWQGARPLAILQTGEHPLWFLFSPDGPIHIESIYDAVYYSAFIPWTHAMHVSFFAENNNAFIMAVNRDGFLKFDESTGVLAMFRFPGGELWRQYTIGSFVFFQGNPAVTLYLDNRFSDLYHTIPNPRTWTFNMESNAVLPLNIPALQLFSEEEGWDIDALRYGSDGMFYYRAVKRSGANPEVRTFRTADLASSGEEIPIDVFFNSAPRREALFHSSLPLLPEGFFYTGIGSVGDNLFAVWEEQTDFNIGAAGFVVLKP